MRAIKGDVRMFCPKCGNNLPDTAMFCSSCGYKFEKKEKAKKCLSPKVRKIVLAVIGICICLSLLVYFVFFHTSNDNWRGTFYFGTREVHISQYMGEEREVVVPKTIKRGWILYDVTGIEDYAFRRCDSPTSIEIPDGVTEIGEGAFWECDSLISIEIPDGVKSIGQSAFYGCENLISIEIPDGVTEIGDYTFMECDMLTSIEIPDSVTSIGRFAFSECSSLTNIKIPDSVTYIDEGAFSGCRNLTSIEIPKFLHYYITDAGIPRECNVIGR